jgi:hypothetical protein
MTTPEQTGAQGAGPAPRPALPDDLLLPEPRRRPSALRLVAIALVSILLTGLLFRFGVEAVRWLSGV